MLHLSIEVLLIGWGIISICQFILAIIALKINNLAIVDLFWPIGLIMLSFVYFLLGKPHFSTYEPIYFIVFTLITIWGLRLFLFLLFTRILKKKQDHRYEKMKSKWGSNQYLQTILNFQFQGLCQLILSLSFFCVFTCTQIRNFDFFYLVYTIIFLIGFIGESLADFQLFRFKLTNTNASSFYQDGLFYYMRRPNYFFDWISWIGISLFSLHFKYGMLAVLSVVFLGFIFRKITGPITEKASLKKYGDSYHDYMSKTNMFFPTFFKRDSI